METPRIDLRALRYFTVLAEELHFGKAAERLHIAQPALSIRIRELENTLGGKLFIRNRRNVTLTPTGQRFLTDARALLRQAAAIEENARRAFRGETGRLELGYADNEAWSGILARLLERFKTVRPGITVGLHEMHPASQIDRLQKGDIQAGILTTLALPLPENMASFPLACWPLEIALPENHPLASRDTVTPDALENERFIVYAMREDDDGDRIARTLLGKSPAIAHRTGNAAMMAALVAAGEGVALLPTLFKGILTLPGIVTRPLQPGLDMDCTLVWRKHDDDPVLAAFLDAVRPLATGTANGTL